MEQLRQVALAGIADELEESEEKLKELKQRERHARADFDRATDMSIKASNSARQAQQRFEILNTATTEEIQQVLNSLDMADVAMNYITHLGGSVEGLQEYSRGNAVDTYVSDRIKRQRAQASQTGASTGARPASPQGGDREARE